MHTPRPIAVALLTAFTLLAQTPTGIDPKDLDRSADPCNDLDQFTNGGWRTANPIPADQTTWARRSVMAETTRSELRTILEAAGAAENVVPPAPKGSSAQLLGDFYDSCTNEPRLDQAGIAPVAPLLNEIRGISDARGVNQEILHLAAIRIYAPFVVTASSDPHDPTRVIADIDSAPLGLPDRDYYLSTETRFASARTRYLEHVAKVFVLAGEPETNAATLAREVIRLETTFATATLPRADHRNPKNVDHPTTFAALERETPAIAWKKLFDDEKIPRIALNVEQPKFLEAVSRAVEQEPVSAWKAYLEWTLLRTASPSLSAPFVNEDFAFQGAYLNGLKANRPRWQRCVIAADANLGELLGHEYVNRYFPPEAKVRVRQMAENIAAAMKDTIAHTEWMTPTTRQKALEKMDLLSIKVGYPDKWKDYSHVVLGRDSYWANLVALRRFAREDDLGTIGKPVDRTRWDMTPPTANAYYNPNLNEVVVPAGYLQSPGFDLKAPDAVNYGSIGVTIGHEISHSVDDEGSQYDGHGRLVNWWTPEDYAQFQARADCVVRQFEGYFIEPGIHHNGRLVLGEAIGDLAGVKMAYLAFHKTIDGAPGGNNLALDGFTPDQQFFMAEARWRGAADRPERLRLLVQIDPHPTSKFRVIGPLSDMPQFQTAFGCKANAMMVRPASERCTVW